MAMSTKMRRRQGGGADPSRASAAAEGGKKKKKSRNPKPYLAPQNGEVADELVQDAGDMIDEGEASDAGQSSDGETKTTASLRQNGSSADFLLKLDERQVSRTNAETKRLRQQDLARERAQNGKDRKGKRKAQEAESEAESTDMEGASVASSFSEGSDDEDVDSEMGSGAEDAYAARLQHLAKRREREDDEERSKQKKKRLPTREDVNGWDSGEEEEEDDEEESDESETDEAGRQKPSTKKVERKPASRAIHDTLDGVSGSEDEGESSASRPALPKSSILTAARFGMQSPYAIMTQKKRSIRLQLAREQIARLSTEIVNDPELTLGLVRRLAVFAGPRVTAPDDDDKMADVDDAVRAFAILSLCAVFVDILPGYRIRSLTEAEQKERVNQDLARRREWEQGLVIVYRNYLEMCERVARRNTPLFDVSVKAMCTLAVKATHFNYRTNLVRSLVSCLSRRKWDDASRECSTALIDVLKHDRQGEVSLEIVRLLNRMIKERRFKVHASVVDILAHLRLRDELAQGKRADTVNATSINKNNDQYNKKLKAKDIRKGKGEHLSKKGVKRVKELREIEGEMKEAEAEIDQEERERHQTETLKLLFVLYFSVIKAPTATDGLLMATLRGLRLFAHRINIDFFRDLLSVLRVHVRVALDRDDDEVEVIRKESEEDDEESGSEDDDMVVSTYNPALALHCIVTSLELLNGQGEALNLDLSDVVGQLYTVMLPLCNYAAIEDAHTMAGATVSDATSVARLLLRALHLALVVPQRNAVPTERLASFVVRMLMCALQMPPKTSLALLDMVLILTRRNDAVKTLLDNGDDRARNGHFDPSNDVVEGLRPLQAGFVAWPLSALSEHVHGDIALRATEIATTAAT